jgi:hypothetical protein
MVTPKPIKEIGKTVDALAIMGFSPKLLLTAPGGTKLAFSGTYSEELDLRLAGHWL